MTTLNEWIDTKIKDGDINYFEYDEFCNMEKVGEGAFGIVNRSDCKSCGIQVALKFLANNPSINENKINKFLSRELNNLRKVSFHPNIIGFYGITKEPSTNNHIMVLQYANQGNLREYLKNSFSSLQWNDKIRMAKDITLGLKCLHSKEIIHRDLHAKNILIHDNKLMIADFGLSKQLTEVTSNSNVYGMPAYIDPQCFKNENFVRDKRSDIYSLGVLLWEITSGHPPFLKIPGSALSYKIAIGNREQSVAGTPSNYVKLYQKCWNDDPNQRPTVDGVLNTLEKFSLQSNINNEIVEDLSRLSINNEETSDLINQNNLPSQLSKLTNITDSSVRELSLSQLENEINKADKLDELGDFVKRPGLGVLGPLCFGCFSKHFQQDFDKWTSGNKDIDKLIQDSQLSAISCFSAVLEWIPYNKFNDIKYIAKGCFAEVYSATWIDGIIENWDHKSNNWKREGPVNVALKVFDNSSKNLRKDFINEMETFKKNKDYVGLMKCYGITQVPDTQNYALVLRLMNGSLRSYLDQNFNSMTWKKKLDIIYEICNGLHALHNHNLTHKDLHLGNVLHVLHSPTEFSTCISDFGFCKPADETTLNSSNEKIYGVMPYMAPEILRGKEYTKASDIYSFGIIINEIISIIPPFNKEPHDLHLALDICRGRRPEIREETPGLLKELIQKCWDANPENRPTSNEVCSKIRNYIYKDDLWKDYTKQVEELEELSYDFTESTDAIFETHPQAIYTSRLLSFSNLSEPVNCPNQEEFISSRYIEKVNLHSICLESVIID